MKSIDLELMRGFAKSAYHGECPVGCGDDDPTCSIVDDLVRAIYELCDEVEELRKGKE